MNGAEPSRRALLTVAGTIPADLDDAVAAGRRPRADYRVMAEHFDAEVLDVVGARATAGRSGRIIERVAGAGPLLAWACFRRRRDHEVIVTDSEEVGLPLAALLGLVRRRPRHVIITHRLSPAKKRWMIRGLRLRRAIDDLVVYSSPQRAVAIELGFPASNVHLHPFMVDTEFWRPDAVERTCSAAARLMICSAGQELRDYPTLLSAVEGLDVDVVIGAASPWSRRADSTAGADVPSNVTIDRFDLHQLRQLYADADIVVVPLVETDFQAGITTILEAMAMGVPVIVTRTAGQRDTVIEGETGRYVPPGDAAALRAIIEELAHDEPQRRKLGADARRWAQAHADIAVYASSLTTIM